MPTSSPDLLARSIATIRDGQHPSGAYVASPTYPTYKYAWLRDGSFCAYAMDLRGESDSANAFHSFVSQTLLAQRDHIAVARHAARNGTPITQTVPTRYTLTGNIESHPEQWSNFQLDGYGTWLWTLRDHGQRHGSLADQYLEAASLTADYVSATRHLPCYDCWEELPQWRHTSTLASQIAGLEAAGDLLARPELMIEADELRGQLSTTHLNNGAYTKHNGTTAVDASLLWLAVPFKVLAPNDPTMVATVQRITAELTGPSGGVRRYIGDEFYGGGEWILLTAWLGWYQAVLGNHDSALAAKTWIASSATAEGWLPEQVIDHPQDPATVQPWIQRWGPVATPLLWSHAMYLVLDHVIAAAKPASSSRIEESLGSAALPPAMS